MSHITVVKAKIRFTDRAALKSALEQSGQVLEGKGAMTLILKENLAPLNFMQMPGEWQPRADQWGGLTERYQAIVSKVGQQYTKTLTQNFITKNHLSILSQDIDEKENIRIKVRSY